MRKNRYLESSKLPCGGWSYKLLFSNRKEPSCLHFPAKERGTQRNRQDFLMATLLAEITR